MKNGVVRRAKELRSVVHRPFHSPSPLDIAVDPAKPDLLDMRDYCGTRANAKGTRTHLRPEPEPAVMEMWRQDLALLDLDELTRCEQQVLNARIVGFTLAEVAEELDISVATAWRREKRAVFKLSGVTTHER